MKSANGGGSTKCLTDCTCGRHYHDPELSRQAALKQWKDNDKRRTEMSLNSPGRDPSQETRTKMVKAWALRRERGVTNETRQKQSVSTKKRWANDDGTWRASIVKGLVHSRGMSEPERLFEALLIEARMSYETQWQVGRFTPDFYLPEFNQLVDIDGCWVHSCPEHYPQGGLVSDLFEQRHVELTKAGYYSTRIWAHELDKGGKAK